MLHLLSNWNQTVPSCKVDIIIVVTSIRFYGKGILHNLLRADDWIIFVAVVLNLGDTILPLVGLKYGLGYHLLDIGPVNIVPNLQVSASISISQASHVIRFSDSSAANPRSYMPAAYSFQQQSVSRRSQSASRTSGCSRAPVIRSSATRSLHSSRFIQSF